MGCEKGSTTMRTCDKQISRSLKRTVVCDAWRGYIESEIERVTGLSIVRSARWNGENTPVVHLRRDHIDRSGKVSRCILGWGSRHVVLI
jgi:Arc/MetJ family transcription regulator